MLTALALASFFATATPRLLPVAESRTMNDAAPVAAELAGTTLIVANGRYTVFARRMRGDTLLDPRGIILDSADSASGINVVPTDAGFLVVWTPIGLKRWVYWRLVRPDGTVGDWHNRAGCGSIIAAGSGDRVMISARDDHGGCGHFLMLVGADGTPIADVPLDISVRAIAAEPARFVVMTDSQAIRVDRDGHVATGSSFPTGVKGNWRAVFDGTATVFAWTPTPGAGVYTERLPPGTEQMEGGDRVADGDLVSLTAANGRAWLTYASGGVARAVPTDGKTAGQPLTLPGTTATVLQLAFRPLVLWTDNGRIRGWLVPFTSTFDVATIQATQLTAVAATDGAAHMAVWAANDGQSAWIEAGTLFPDHTVSAKSGVRLSGSNHRVHEPALAYGAGMFLAVWLADDGLYGARINASLRLIDRTPFLIDGDVAAGALEQGAIAPSVAFDGAQWLVVYGQPVRAVRVSSSGVVLDKPPIALSSPARSAFYGPRVAFDGHSFVVTWDDSFWIPHKTPYFSWIDAARVNVDGSVDAITRLSATASSGNFKPDDPYWILSPQIAVAGGRTLIAWAEVLASQRGTARGVLLAEPRDEGSRRRAAPAVRRPIPVVEMPSFGVLCSDGQRFFQFAPQRVVAFTDPDASADVTDLELETPGSVEDCSANALGVVAVVSHDDATTGTQRMFWLVP